MSKLEDIMATSYEKLLDYALTHQGDPDATTIPQLRKDLEAAQRRAERLENIRTDLEKTQNILNQERREHTEERDVLLRRNTELTELLQQRDFEITEYEADATTNQQRFEQLQTQLDKANANNPLDATERADLVRLVGQAVEYFEEDPDRAHKALTRAHLTLTGDKE